MLIDHDKLLVALQHGFNRILKALRRTDLTALNFIKDLFPVAFYNRLFDKLPQGIQLPFCKNGSFRIVFFILFCIYGIIFMTNIIMHTDTGTYPDLIVLNRGIIISDQLRI